ncbi:MAG: hypothetical protein HZA91_11010 [Verrucomicrobia bacterium]|nr:hypothetical protein [Verrucomicrobiota bacterium]
MKVRLVSEITVLCMAVVLVGTWQGWLDVPESALIAATMCLATALAMLLHSAWRKTPKE